MNLKQQFKEIFWNYSDFWNYYQEDLKLCMDKNAAKNFIDAYFHAASKENVVVDWLDQIEEYDELSYTHSVITFFIGIMLQYRIDKDLCIITEEKENSRYPFSYLWFLTCLAHDIGYQCERASNNEIREIQKTFMELGNHQGKSPFREIVYQQLRKKAIIVPHRSRRCFMPPPYFITVGGRYLGRTKKRKYGFRYNNSEIEMKQWYSPDIEEAYFRYRFWNMDVVDHGIVGADYLYEKLCQNYKEQQRNNRSIGNDNAFWNREGKYFSNGQKAVYAYIADCVAAHNIFMAKKNWKCMKLYMEYNLVELLPQNFPKIDYKKDPLLFILCIADTIEPTKRFPNSKDVLEKVHINFIESNNTLLYHVDADLGTDQERAQYINGIKSLVEWCNVSVKEI